MNTEATDGLVARLRKPHWCKLSTGDQIPPCAQCHAERDEAADRIEALERRLALCEDQDCPAGSELR